jgi:hypothetical protein
MAWKHVYTVPHTVLPGIDFPQGLTEWMTEANGLIWMKGTGASLRGYNPSNGALVTTHSFGHSSSVSESELLTDQAGRIWGLGDSGLGAGKFNCRVIDPSTGAVVATIGDRTTEYGTNSRAYDPINGKVWMYRNTTTVQSFGTATLTTSTTISDRASGGVTCDTDKGQVWVANNTAKTVKYYNGATGALVGTISMSYPYSMEGGLKYFPEAKIVVASDKENVTFISTETYTVLGTYNFGNGYFTYAPRGYHKKSNTFLTATMGTDENPPYGGLQHLTSTGTVAPYNIAYLTTDHAPSNNCFVIGDDLYVITAEYDGSWSFWLEKYTWTTPLTFGDPVIPGDDGVAWNGLGAPPDSRDNFNREIIFDLNLEAFYLYDFSHNNVDANLPRVHDYIPIPSYVDQTGVSGVVRLTRNTNDRLENFKFLASGLGHVSIAEYRDDNFRDWAIVNGTGFHYASYLLTGPMVLNTFALNKQGIYLTCYFWRTEIKYLTNPVTSAIELRIPSACTARGLWDWHRTSAGRSKWSNPFSVYKLRSATIPDSPVDGELLDYPEALTITKNKLRGRGRSLALFFSAEEGKDMRLLGWNLPITQASNV